MFSNKFIFEYLVGLFQAFLHQWAMVVGQLAERLLLATVILGLNPDIGKTLIKRSVHCNMFRKDEN